MKRKNMLLALLMSVTIIASLATGCSKEITSSIADSTTATTTTVATTTTAATTTAATTTAVTTAATTAKPAVTTAKAAVTTAKAAVTTAKPAVTTAKPVVTAAQIAVTAAPAPVTAAVSGSGKYVYNTQLNDEEKTIYNEIVAAVNARLDTCTFTSPHDGATVTKVFQDVFYQESELFWLYGSGSIHSGNISSFPLTYKYNAADQAVMQQNLTASMAAISAQFPAGASVTTKLKVIHDYIILKTAFSKEHINAKDAYGPLVSGWGQCEGYAKALSYACTYFGIENVRITGTNDHGLSHAWNKVQINGAWYNVDLTWDDPEGHTADFIVYNYLLVPDAQINGLSHMVDCSFTPPAANSLDLNYFVQHGLYVSSAADAVSKLQSVMINSAKTKNQVAEVKCATKEVYDAAIATLTGNNYTVLLGLQATVNSTAGCNRVANIADGSDSNTLVIRINLIY